MMARYIDADKCNSFFFEHLDDQHMKIAMIAINEMPTEDVAPVTHAHWILGGAHGFDESITNIMHCSNCKAYFRYHGRKKNVNYCYRCGAVMDEPMRKQQK